MPLTLDPESFLSPTLIRLFCHFILARHALVTFCFSPTNPSIAFLFTFNFHGNLRLGQLFPFFCPCASVDVVICLVRRHSSAVPTAIRSISFITYLIVFCLACFLLTLFNQFVILSFPFLLRRRHVTLSQWRFPFSQSVSSTIDLNAILNGTVTLSKNCEHLCTLHFLTTDPESPAEHVRAT